MGMSDESSFNVPDSEVESRALPLIRNGSRELSEKKDVPLLARLCEGSYSVQVKASEVILC